MCKCIDVQFGTFGQPETQNRTAVKTCMDKLQEIDNCILDELKSLWDREIITYASCCGHNIVSGSIIIDNLFSAFRMRDMGYVEYSDPGLQGFWFYPKSTPITNKFND